MAGIADDGSLGGAPSKGGGGSTGMSPSELSMCKSIMRELRKKDIAEAFLVPVDWKALGIPDYPTIIKRPMDLGTVQSQLEGGQYSSVQARSPSTPLPHTPTPHTLSHTPYPTPLPPFTITLTPANTR